MELSYEWIKLSENFDCRLLNELSDTSIEIVEGGWQIKNENFTIKLAFVEDRANTVILHASEYNSTRDMEKKEIQEKYNIQRPYKIRLVVKNINFETLEFIPKSARLRNSEYESESFSLYLAKTSVAQTFVKIIFPEKPIKIQKGGEEIFSLSVFDHIPLFWAMGNENYFTITLYFVTETKVFYLNLELRPTSDVIMTQLAETKSL
jgi:hypothetical protein